MTATPARIRIKNALFKEYEDDLLYGDYEAIANIALDALREPTNEVIDLFLQELDGEWGQHPDPSAEGDRSAIRTTERRLAITYAWRRAFDLMKAGR